MDSGQACSGREQVERGSAQAIKGEGKNVPVLSPIKGEETGWGDFANISKHSSILLTWQLP